MEKLIKLLNKRGLYNTFKVFSIFDQYRADKHSFYQKLTEFSHYNSFLRIKDKLLEKNILVIHNNNRTTYFELTPKGKHIFSLLKELEELLE
ncbi:MAG: hypothetical protein ACFE9Q_17375 [Candidatus Hodarchaeota archaeon]